MYTRLHGVHMNLIHLVCIPFNFLYDSPSALVLLNTSISLDYYLMFFISY